MSNLVSKIYKEISNVPTPYIPNAIYYVRVGIGIDIFVADSTGTNIHKHNTNSETIYYEEIDLGNLGKNNHSINIINALVLISSKIDVSFYYIDELQDNDSELDDFIFKTKIYTNGNFDLLIYSKNKINKKINIKYKIN